MFRPRTLFAALVAIAALGVVPSPAEAAQTRLCVFNGNFTPNKTLSTTTAISTGFAVNYALNLNSGCGASFTGTLTGTCTQFRGQGAMDGRAFTFSAVGPVLTFSGAVRGTVELWQEGQLTPWCSPAQPVYDAVGELVWDY